MRYRTKQKVYKRWSTNDWELKRNVQHPLSFENDKAAQLWDFILHHQEWPRQSNKWQLMLVRTWRKVNSSSQVGRQTYTTDVEISVAVPRKLGVDLPQNLAILIKPSTQRTLHPTTETLAHLHSSLLYS